MTGPGTAFRLRRAELGDTHDPTELVPGDPAAVQHTADDLDALGGVLTAAGEGLRRIDSGGWSGAAAERFHEVFRPEPGRWIGAGDALIVAGAALADYVGTLSWAQTQAGEAIALWEQGTAETAEAKAAHADAVRQAARSAGIGAAPTLVPEIPFHDPGATTRARARELLNRARTQLDEAGDRAEGVVSGSRDQAPPEPRWWQKAWAAATDYRAGVYESSLGLAEFAWSVSAVRMVADPVGYAQAVATLAQGAQYAVHHPVETARTAVDWETWQTNPARALGRLAPDLALTIATGGSGAVVRGARAADMVDSLGTAARTADRQLDRTPHPPVDRPIVPAQPTIWADFGPSGHPDTHHQPPGTGTSHADPPEQPDFAEESVWYDPARHPDWYDPGHWDRAGFDLPELDHDLDPTPAPDTDAAPADADGADTAESVNSAENADSSDNTEPAAETKTDGPRATPAGHRSPPPAQAEMPVWVYEGEVSW